MKFHIQDLIMRGRVLSRERNSNSKKKEKKKFQFPLEMIPRPIIGAKKGARIIHTVEAI